MLFLLGFCEGLCVVEYDETNVESLLYDIICLSGFHYIFAFG